MNILLTGGAGYIGSIMTKRLLDEGFQVVVVDNLGRGYREAVDQRAIFIKGDLLDEGFVEKVFSEHPFDAVMHFAAYTSVAESMENPGLYFKNNICGSTHLFEAMKKNRVNKLIFSSSAAVYGNPQKIPIPEDHPKKPTNPYGETKLMIETMLSWYKKIYGLRYVCLRYFNAAGALADQSLGERHDPETHIIPLVIKSILSKEEFVVFGNDYNTPDKTAVRDYIHVSDLAKAHLLALKKIQSFEGGFHYNVGTGKGYSNKEVVEAVKKITGKDIKISYGERRIGDPETLIADPTKIQKELQFDPKYSDLETIVKSAWQWHDKQTSLSEK